MGASDPSEVDEIDVSNPDEVDVQNSQQIFEVADALREEYDRFDEVVGKAKEFSEDEDENKWTIYGIISGMAAPFVGWEWTTIEKLLRDWDVDGYDELPREDSKKLRKFVRSVGDRRRGVEHKNWDNEDYLVELTGWVDDYARMDTVGGGGRNIEEKIYHIKKRWKPSDYHPEPDREHIESINGEQAMQEFAAAFDEEWEFVYPEKDVEEWRNVLYVYDDVVGIYRPRGDSFVKEKSEELLGAEATNTRVNELLSKIKRRNTVDSWEMDGCDPSPFRLVVENGVLDLRAGELDEYDSDEYHRSRIDVRYNPDAECPAIDEFLHDVLPDDEDVETMYRVIAHSLLKEYVDSKAVLLVGDGRNGKSILLSLIEQFLSDRNISGRSLQDITGDRWAPADLHGSLANVNGDMSEQEVRDVSTFKQMTGNDTVTGDIKYENPVRFENHATMVFAANGVPEMPDEDMALWARWVYLNFPYTFGPNGDKEAEPKRKILNRITAEKELEGLLARCVEEIREWWNEGRDFFPNVGKPSEVRRRMKRASDPVAVFAEECLAFPEPDEVSGYDEMAETTYTVREVYELYAESEDIPQIDKSRFGDNLLDYDNRITKTRTRKLADEYDQDRVPVYEGVTLSRKGEELLRYGAEEEPDEGQSQLDEGSRLPERIGGAPRDDIREFIVGTDGVTPEDVKDEFWLPQDSIEHVQVAIDRWADETRDRDE